MLRFLLAWILSCLVCHLPLRAAIDFQVLTETSRIKKALQTDPRALKALAEHQILALEASPQTASWVRIFLAYTLAVNELGALDPLSTRYNQLEEAMNLALTLGLNEEYVLLRYVWVFVPDENGKTQDEAQILHELVRFADRSGHPGARVKTRMDLSYSLRERGDRKEAIRYLNEMNEILQEHSEIDLVDRLIVQNQSAISYLQQGQSEQALALYQSIATVCRREGLSYLGSIIENNLADSLADRAEWDQAAFHYRQALETAKKQENQWLEATVTLNLARIHLQRKEIDEARALALGSATLFATNDDDIGRADAYHVLALQAIATQSWETALSYVDKSEALYKKHDYKTNVRDLIEARALVEEGKGEVRLALQLMKNYIESYKKQNAETNQKNFAELLVSMGLKVEAERNRTLEKENERQAQEIAASRKIRLAFLVMVVLSCGILVLLVQVSKRSKEIAKGKVKIQRILDHIEEGIFTINMQLQIEGESSAFLKAIFALKEAPTGHDALDVLLGASQFHGDERQMIREVLKASLGEDILAFELNEAHLPRELHLGGDLQKTVLLHWTPLLDHEGKVHSFLVILHDVTEQRRLAAAIEVEKSKSQEREQRILEIVRAERTALRKVLTDARWALERLHKSIENESEIQELMRDLHTIKGVARSLGMRALSLATHELEGTLLLERNNTFSSDPASEPHFRNFVGILEEYEALLGEMEQGSPILRAEDGNLAREVGRQQNMILKLLKRQQISCERVEVIDTVVHWPEELLQAVGEILVHGLTNSVDHGFHLPKQRGLEVAPAKFTISAKQEGAFVRLDIMDNGLGLDLDLLRALGKQRAWKGDTFADLTPMLFLDGFSTAEKATPTSGRGVGLSAIRSIAEKWQGSADIMPRDSERGCCLTVRLRKGLVANLPARSGTAA